MTWVPPARPPEERPASPTRYEDLGLLAAGAMGEVRRVRDHLLDRVVAMKVLAPDRVGSAAARARFVAEATLTATLRHPGILAVHDRGELADGSLWYTMEIVHGGTLRAYLSAGGNLPARVSAVRRVCDAVAYAHQHGVVHRDLKPENVMLDEFGEVRVVDWGIAARVGDPAEGGLGTPGWVSPEQARGCAPDPRCDVYALGALLYLAITGEPVRRGTPAELWRAVQDEPPVVFPAPRPDVPEALARWCRAALAADPTARPDASSLGAGLAAWIADEARAEEAARAVAAVAAELPELDTRRAAIAALRDRADAWLSSLPPDASPEDKRGAWDLEDLATEQDRELTVTEARWVAAVDALLERHPGNPAGRALLADHHAAELVRAEATGRERDALRAELQLRRHDDGRYTRLLDGTGTVTLVTDPPGADVELLRVVERGRRLVEEPAGTLGRTPLRRAPLDRGSWVLVLRAEGHAPVRYPVRVGRGAEWDAVRPGDAAPHPIRLPPAGALGPDDAYVPAGWFLAGGDRAALDGLAQRALWVDGLVVRRFPVTNRAYLAYLDALVADGREAEALRHCPRDTSTGALLVDRGPHGRFCLRDGADQHPRLADEPVTFVDAAGARAFAAYEAARTGIPWRLPHDLEWEKVARGVDGRAFPWGNHLDPAWTCMQLTHRGAPVRARVDAFPVDESVYGVRGLGGNVRDWCDNAYRKTGPPPDEPIVLPQPAPPDTVHQMVRGGSFGSNADLCRAATRVVWHPTTRGSVVGVRLVASFR